MPELPEVETVCQGLKAALDGAVIAEVTLRRKNLRIPFPEDFTQRLEGKAITGIRRRAKYLLFDIAGEDVMIAHLGMSGHFTVASNPPKSYEKHDHVVIRLTDGKVVIYNDVRRFGLITLARKEELSEHPLLAGLGPEPLENSFSPAYLARALSTRNTALKVALMDQSVVVGVGNIYASEALFLAGIKPKTPANQAVDQAKLLIQCIRKVLNDAIKSGGSTLRDHVQVTGETGYFQHHFNVYGRSGKPCFSCGTPIKSERLSGRSTFFCAECQS